MRATYPLGYDAQPEAARWRRSTSSSGSARSPGPDAIYSAGVGQHQMWAAQFIKYEKPGTWLNSGGLGTMGYAVPAAMGAKVGRPDATVWAIDGDGCFQMTNQELATCALNDIPIKVAVINNGTPRHGPAVADAVLRQRYSNTDLHSRAHPRLREAGGGVRLRRAALRDRTTTSTPRSRRRWRSTTGPVVVDFVVHQDAMVWPMVAAGTSNDDIKVARDLAPVWDRRSATDEPAHAVRPGREPARCPGPDRRAVLPARLQHRLARRRSDRALRRSRA